ncbi:hypothetical protein VTN77DRAFT_5115 [Rasamsonia byssochlamydoides]|uniref:uncharacterized protein n=1 Tax=Rasamsonia byssochlamydoides TaxID=89139 RepID=UPI00374243BD
MRSLKIDMELKRDACRRRECHVQIIDCGAFPFGPCKNIVMEQLQLAHRGGYTREECLMYRDDVRQDVMSVVKKLVEFLQISEVELDEKSNAHVKAIAHELDLHFWDQVKYAPCDKVMNTVFPGYEDLTAIMLVVDLALCNQRSADPDLNVMTNALNRFDRLVNSPRLAHCCFILLLSNVNTFRRQVASSVLDDWFPDHFAGSKDVNGTIEYLIGQFRLRNRGKSPLYPYLLADATDVANFRSILASIQQVLLRDSFTCMLKRLADRVSGRKKNANSAFQNDEFLSSAMFDYCMEELRDKVVFYQKSGMISVLDCDTAVVKSDVLVPALLAESLRDSGEPVDPPLADDHRYHLKSGAWSIGISLKAWGSFQWLPSNVSFSEDGSPKITSYINNLHPQKHKDLYGILEQFVACSIPLWNECLSWFQRRYRVQAVEASLEDFILPAGMKYYPPRDGADGQFDSDDESDGITLEEVRKDGLFWEPDFQRWFLQHRILIQKEPDAFLSRKHWESRRGHRPVDLQKDFRSVGLQIIFKLANIHPTPENPEYEGGSWHIEGALNEHICATALYYYDEQNITKSNLAFRQSIDAEVMGLSHEQYEYESLEICYGIQNEEAAIQELGHVLTRPGRLLAFPNVLQHQVQPFRLADPTKPGHRKIFAMFLVDPYVRVLSTANVPPQRRDWWAVEVRKIPPFDTLPKELFDMIIGFVDGFPLSWEEAV